jgi:hypothetical protein
MRQAVAQELQHKQCEADDAPGSTVIQINSTTWDGKQQAMIHVP